MELNEIPYLTIRDRDDIFWGPIYVNGFLVNKIYFPTLSKEYKGKDLIDFIWLVNNLATDLSEITNETKLIKVFVSLISSIPGKFKVKTHYQALHVQKRKLTDDKNREKASSYLSKTRKNTKTAIKYYLRSHSHPIFRFCRLTTRTTSNNVIRTSLATFFNKFLGLVYTELLGFIILPTGEKVKVKLRIRLDSRYFVNAMFIKREYLSNLTGEGIFDCDNLREHNLNIQNTGLLIINPRQKHKEKTT